MTERESERVCARERDRHTDRQRDRELKYIESRGCDDKRLKVSKKDRIEYERTG